MRASWSESGPEVVENGYNIMGVVLCNYRGGMLDFALAHGLIFSQLNQYRPARSMGIKQTLPFAGTAAGKKKRTERLGRKNDKKCKQQIIKTCRSERFRGR